MVLVLDDEVSSETVADLLEQTVVLDGIGRTLLGGSGMQYALYQ